MLQKAEFFTTGDNVTLWLFDEKRTTDKLFAQHIPPDYPLYPLLKLLQTLAEFPEQKKVFL